MYLTWRQLINEINEYPHLLDEPALVWVPNDCNHPEFSHVKNVGPYDYDQPASKDNELSLYIEEDWD